MGRKNRNANQPLIITAEQVFDMEKPRFNAHQTGTGAHKSKKAYDRKAKHPNRQEW